MENTFYRVKYENKTIGKFQTRDEATEFCNDYARRMVPPTVSPSQFKDTTVEFTIELTEDKKVVSIEYYTSIIIMKK